MIEVDLNNLDSTVLNQTCLKALVALGDPESRKELGRGGRQVFTEAVQGLREIRKFLAGPKRPKVKDRYQMLLYSVGNPDYGQYAPVSDPKWVSGNSLRVMRSRALSYQKTYELGGGNWPHPEVLEGDKVIGNFSYNLRFWEGKWKSENWQNQKEILIDEPKEKEAKEKG